MRSTFMHTTTPHRQQAHTQPVIQAVLSRLTAAQQAQQQAIRRFTTTYQRQLRQHLQQAISLTDGMHPRRLAATLSRPGEVPQAQTQHIRSIKRQARRISMRSSALRAMHLTYTLYTTRRQIRQHIRAEQPAVQYRAAAHTFTVRRTTSVQRQQQATSLMAGTTETQQMFRVHLYQQATR